jgi:hypothetical protein
VRALLFVSAVALLGAFYCPTDLQAADQACEIFPVPCVFEGLPFQITVVDAATRKPLAAVHALAEWRRYGKGDRLNGPLMVQDAVSSAEGTLKFPSWGPVEGSASGLGLGFDPAITLFRTGYKTLIIINGPRPGMNEQERRRGFHPDRAAYGLEPFRGTSEEWLEELEKVWIGEAVSRTDEMTLAFRQPYLNRLLHVSAERRNVAPAPGPYGGSFFWHVDRELKFLQEGHR